MRRGVVAILGAVLLGAVGAAAQEVPARVRVEPLRCEALPFAREAWETLLRTELESDGVAEVRFAEGGGEALAVIRVELSRCAADATELAVVIDDALTRKSVRRAVDLADVPASGRPRALALAVAELLRASWAELALPTAPPPPTPAPEVVRRAVVVRLADALTREGAVRPPPAPRAVASPRRWSLGAAFAVLNFPAANAALLGGRVRATVIPSHAWPLRLSADVGASAGTAFDPLGEIDLGLFSGALAVTVRGGGDRVALELGPRVELGYAWVQGRPATASVRAGSGEAVVFFASVLASVQVRLGGRWWTTLDALAGTSLRPVTIASGAARAAGFTGPTLSLALGLAVEL